MGSKKYVVTGGCGFIGSHLVDRLLKEGAQVTVLDNLSTGRRFNLNSAASDAHLNIVEQDISIPSFDGTVMEGADCVFHLAALADIVPSVENPLKYYQSNVTGTAHLLEAIRKYKVKKIVYAASSSCYGLPESFPTLETAPAKPEYPYALTKYMGEQLVLHWNKLYRIPALSLRFFNVYGPRSRTSGTYGAVFGVFLAQKLAGKPLTIVGDGSQTRDFTYVSDVVDAVFQASQSDIQGEIFNVGSGATVSVNRLAALIGGSTVHIPKRPGEPDCTLADISKIKSRLGWSPRISIEEGVKRMLEHLNDWKDAKVWTPETIQVATQDWFRYLAPAPVAAGIQKNPPKSL